MGLKILPPGINSGSYRSRVNDGGETAYGIGAIKGVGEDSVEAIVKARSRGSYFHELLDLHARTDTKKPNRRVLEKLIMSGASDRLGLHRAVLMNPLGGALKATDQHARAEAIGRAGMFDVLAEKPEQIEQSYASYQPWPKQVVLDGEHGMLGLYLMGRPINQYLKEIGRCVGGVRLKDMYLAERGKVITAAGLVTTAWVMATKRSNRIGICTLDDRSGRLEMMLFIDTLDKYRQLSEKDHVLVIGGQVSFDDFNGGLKMIIHEMMNIDKTREKYAHELIISSTDRQINDQLLSRLRRSLEPHHSGTIPIHLYYRGADACVRLRFGVTWRVSPSDRLLNDLRSLIGSEQVELEFDQYRNTMSLNFPSFEQPVAELEAEINSPTAVSRQDKELGINIDEEVYRLREESIELVRKIFADLGAWQTAQLAHHPWHPYTPDYIRPASDEFNEPTGGRAYASDKAVVGGIARPDSRPVMIIGHQKGYEAKEKIRRNFSMPAPEGYRKALRLVQMVERFKILIITFIDTPGAYLGAGAKGRGQSEAIARNLREMPCLGILVVCTVIDEGSSCLLYASPSP